ncbi:MAG: hypothetical protein ACLQVK_26740 [Acidimicrobiales bacterium]
MISGIPTAAGAYHVIVVATDAARATTTAEMSITV